MPLRGLLYRKLKQKMAEAKAKSAVKKKQQVKEEKSPAKIEPVKTKTVTPEPVKAKPQVEDKRRDEGIELIKGSARYWGGHFLYPIKTVELGEIVVKDQAIAFVKYGFLKKLEWSMEIPLSKVEWSKVSEAMEEEGPFNITCFTIPFKDEKGVKHRPKFSVENSSARQRFSKFLYERMTRRG